MNQTSDDAATKRAASGNAGAAPKAPWTINDDGTVTVQLKRPLETHAGSVTSLTIREPAADVYFRHGAPFETIPIIDGAGDVSSVQTSVKAQVVLKYLAACTDHDEVVLGQMRAFDAARCGNAMVSVFFGDAGN